MPHICGSTTPCTSAQAMPASTALPPSRNTSAPASVGSGCGATIIACFWYRTVVPPTLGWRDSIPTVALAQHRQSPGPARGPCPAPSAATRPAPAASPRADGRSPPRSPAGAPRPRPRRACAAPPRPIPRRRGRRGARSPGTPSSCAVWSPTDCAVVRESRNISPRGFSCRSASLHARPEGREAAAHVIVDAGETLEAVERRHRALADFHVAHRDQQCARSGIVAPGRFHRQVQHQLMATAACRPRLLAQVLGIRQERHGERPW